jgi:sec-independent protein translocase protein TatA
MLRQLGPTELLIILGIVILLFGVGRLSKIGSELGQGIRAFRTGLKGDDQENKEEGEEKAQEEGAKPTE